MKLFASRTGRFLSYCFHYYRDRPGSLKERLLPRVINLPVTDNCNSRCVMCDVWKTSSENELTAADLESILGNRLFRKVTDVGISGGEPTLRRDLPEIVSAIAGSLPALRAISLTTHGFNLKRHERFLPEIKRICENSGIGFNLNISIDGIGPAHDSIRGIPNGYARSLRCLHLAKGLGIPVQIQSTITRGNIYQLEGLCQLAEKESAGIIFRKAVLIPRLDNQESIKRTIIGAHEESFFGDFIDSERCKQITPSPVRRLWYRDLLRRLRRRGKRRAPCAYQNEGVLLDAHGNLFHCSIGTECIGNALKADAYDLYFSPEAEQIRQRLLKQKCPGCLHDQTGRWKPTALLKESLVRSRFGLWLKANRPRPAYFLRPAASMLIYRLMRRRTADTDTKLSGQKLSGGKAVLIGCYGGEHVGDAAILGGVCLRLEREFGIQCFDLLSIRPDRTQCWVDSIHFKERVQVHPYSIRNAPDFLQDADLLVLAGGPLMELPGLIERHLWMASIARRKGIPFLIEGIGFGPFKKRFSRFIARGILLHANRITARSPGDEKQISKYGIRARVVDDPAFDYLSWSAESIPSAVLKDSLQDNFNTRKRVAAINLRPLWNIYAPPGTTQEDLSRLNEKLLSEITALIKRSSDDWRFVFVPFNVDQFGFSDLQVGVQLRNLVGDDSDFRLIESELRISECVSLIRKASCLIAMRFHACIFGLNSGVPVAGIDYSIGAKGKVFHLMEKQTAPHGLFRINEVTADGLSEFLNGLYCPASHEI